MRAPESTTTSGSNKRNSYSSSLGPPVNQRKSAKASASGQQAANKPQRAAANARQQQQQDKVSQANETRMRQLEEENEKEEEEEDQAMNRSENVSDVDADEEEDADILAASRHQIDGDDHRKQTHNVIEKRRRDKMNNYIMELASVIPSFSNNQSKFDKLTVLRMAVQHVKSLRSSLCSFSSLHLRPSFLSSGNLLKNLILQMASHEGQENLFMVVTCDRGKVLFVSESSKDILNHEQHELVGQCLFDILHKDDVSKVKEQISYFNLMPKEMLVDSKTLQPIKSHNQRQSFSQLQNQANSMPQPGARRSFFCRMRSGRSAPPPPPPPPNEAKSSSSPSDSSSTASPTSTVSSSSPGSSSSLSSPSSSSLSPSTQPKQQTASACDEIAPKDDSLSTTLNKSSTSNADLNKSAPKTCSESASGRSKNDDGCSIESQSNKCSNLKNCRTSADKYDKNNVRSGAGSSSCVRKSSSKHKVKIKNQQDGNAKSSSMSSHYKTTRANNTHDGCNISRSSRSSSGCVASNSSQTSEQSPDTESIMNSSNSSSRRNKSGFTMKASSESTTSSDQRSKKYWRYIVMHCTGYLKSVTLKSDEFDDDDFDEYKSENNSSDEDENDGCRTINCLVAVCRRSPMDMDLKPDRPLTFTCRYSMEGKFVFVDQRTTVALGYTPQQLLGTSHYAYCHKNSVNTFKECHSQSIQKSEPVSSDIYQFKRANGQHLWLQTSLKSFRNPWTKIIDYIVANHTTAEGNEPHYNEGCVPTKFNQDMTGGEGPQSFSPSSSFTLSLPSIDSSKKSSSPSSSSIGSSYSMDSCASGACIQGLLNRIDKAKSGGLKYALDFHKRKGDSLTTQSSENSSRKSADTSGNSSELQSCSSLTFPNNLVPVDCPMNVIAPFAGYFGDGSYNETSVVANSASNQNVQGNSMNSLRTGQNFTGNYHQQQCQMVSTETGISDSLECKQHQATLNTMQAMRNAKTNTRVTGKVARSMSNTMKQHNHPRHYDNQYHYRNQLKSGSSTSSDTGNESATWSNPSGSDRTNHHELTTQTTGSARTTVATQDQVGRNEGRSSGICQVPFQEHLCQTLQNKLNPYVLHQSVENTPMSIVPAQVTMRDQMSGINSQLPESGYPNNLMPMNTYISQGVAPNFNDGLNMSQMQRMTDDLQPDQMTMTTQDHQQQSQVQHQQPQQQQQQQQRSQGDSNQMSMPMMWNATATGNGNVNPYHNMHAMHSGHCQQICTNGGVTLMNMDVMNTNNLIISQQKGQCQQCANNKCSVRQIMMTNNTDLNSTDLTSLAVDGDLDEDQLIEYLAGCEPSYHIQNNAFPQYNIYR